MSVRYLLTGANGFLGAHLARALLARGDTVRCLVREGADTSALEGLAVERCVGDVTRPQTLGAAMKHAEVVFHLAGIRRGATRDAFLQVNTEGTRLVCEAMVQAGARRLVFCGSLAASGPSTPGRPRREDDPFCPEEWYGESKALAEQLAFGYSNRLQVTSIRPARIVGPGDRENLTFCQIVKRGWVLKIGGPRRPLSLVDVDDTVAQLLLQADSDAAVGQAFFSAGEETISVTELMQQIAAVMGTPARTLYLPQAVVSAIGAGADVVSRLSGRRLPINRKLARQLLAPGWTCSIEKAKRVLGYRPTRTLAQSLRTSCDSYVKLGWL